MRHPQGQDLLHQEIWQGEFSRSFTLPLAVDADKTTATYHNGILTITMAESEAEVTPVRWRD